MKTTCRIIIALGAVLVLGCVGIWFYQNTRERREATKAQSQSSQADVPAPTAPAVPLGFTKTNPPAVAMTPVPESVRAIVAGGDIPFRERVKAIRALPESLTPQEIQAFQAYLLAPATSPSENRQEENWLRNEMLDKLVETQIFPDGLVRVLITVYQDPTQDIALRDYAVQHMGPAYPRASDEEKATLRQTLWEAAEKTDSSIAGTALLALLDLAPSHRELEPDKLGEAALKLAGDDGCGELARITALQICGQMGLNQAGPLLLQLVQKGGSVPLQIAAIAALGDVGNEEARNYLRQLAAQPEPRLMPALNMALKKMNQRLGI